MADMLVKLYALPPLAPLAGRLESEGIVVRPARNFERDEVLDWIRTQFAPRWAAEASAGFSKQPCSTLIATVRQTIIGFACHDATARGFFGPMGVDPEQRGRGVGEALLVHALHAMRERGYGYAIIGAVGPAHFYERAVGAVEIPDSTPGIYTDMLSPPDTAPRNS